MKPILSPTYDDILSRYRQHLFGRALAPMSIETTMSYITFTVRSICSISLEAPARFNDLSARDIMAFIDRPHLKETSRHGNFMRTKGFFNWLEKENFILVNPFVKDIPSRRRDKLLPTKIASVEEIICLLESARGDDFISLRDFTALCVLYSASLRRSEAVRLKVKDFDPSQRSILVRPSKNGEGRLVPIGVGPSERVKVYLALLPRLINPVAVDEESPLFPTRNGRPIRADYLSKLTKTLRDKLELKTPVTSHSLRKSSATHMLRAGAPVEVVQKVLGHKHISSTEVYTKVYPDDLREMLSKFHPREQVAEKDFPELEIPRYVKGKDPFRVPETLG